MKNILTTLLLCILFFSCKKEVQQEKTTAPLIVENDIITEERDSTQEEGKSDHKDLLGYYVGYFQAINLGEIVNKGGSYTNKINISIDLIKNDSLFGHSVVAGNSRPFKGVFNQELVSALVSEPGDDKYDGIFEFIIHPEKSELIGIWSANDSTLAVPKRKYELTKKTFIYDSASNLDLEFHELNIPIVNSQYEDKSELEAIRPELIAPLNASSQELTNQDIENLSKGELEILRNLIYARHGYSFKNRKMRYFFDSEIEWYIPVSTDIRNQLTDLEKKNIDLIKRYEQHAERYYDYFGR